MILGLISNRTGLTLQVQQYRQRCLELESRASVRDRTGESASQRRSERRQDESEDGRPDLDTALIKLEEAEHRSVTRNRHRSAAAVCL